MTLNASRAERNGPHEPPRLPFGNLRLSVATMRSMLVRGAVICALLTAPSLASADPPGARQPNAATRAAVHSGRRLLIMLDRSRRSRNALQIACVELKLSEVNSFARMLSDRQIRLGEARARGDAREVAHLRRVLRRMLAQIQILEREGRACVYPEALEEDRTVLTVSIDPAIRRLDLSIPPLRR